MDADGREQVRDAFPELDRIESDDVRAAVVDAWELAMAENDVDDLAAVPWYPPVETELGLDGERLVPHVRDVTRGALALADTLTERRDLDLDRDLLVAGALCHDVSKLYEFDGHEEQPVHDLLGHPHFGVAVVERAGLSTDVAHVVLAHTSRTSVEPATLEAVLVRRADEAAAAAVRATGLDDLRE